MTSSGEMRREHTAPDQREHRPAGLYQELVKLLYDKRLVRVALTAGAQYLSRGAAILVSLVTIPMARSYLGVELFGAWMVISTLLGFLSFADLGLGNGLINLVTRSVAANDRKRLASVVGSAYLAMVAIAALILVGVLAASRLGSLYTVFGVRGPNQHAVSAALVVFFVLFAINLPAALIQKIQLGLQEGYVAGLWQVCGGALTIVTVALAVHSRQSLAVLVACLFGSQVIANALNTFTSWLRAGRPEIVGVTISRHSVLEVFRTGFLFFVLQLTVAIAYQSDGIVISRYLGPSEAGDYLVAQKVFSIVSVVIGSSTLGLWSAFGDAVARREMKWLVRTLKACILSVLAIAGIVSLSVFLAFGRITQFWLHSSRIAPTTLLACFAVWSVIEAVGGVTGVFLNGANIIRFQVIVAPILTIVAVAGKVVLVQVLGPVGAVLATIGAYLTVSAPAQLLFFWQYFNSNFKADDAAGRMQPAAPAKPY